MKPFDLQKAKLGYPVCTRSGNHVRILCFDRKIDNGNDIVALITQNSEEGFEYIQFYDKYGRTSASCRDYDLMMEDVKYTKWGVIRKTTGDIANKFLFASKEDAEAYANSSNDLKVVKVEWEE